MIQHGATVFWDSGKNGGAITLEWQYLKNAIGVTDANLVRSGSFWYVNTASLPGATVNTIITSAIAETMYSEDNKD